MMIPNTIDAFLADIVTYPQEATAIWLILADWLEDCGDPRAELIRLTRDPAHIDHERANALLFAGLRPVVPTCTNSIGMKFVWIEPGDFLMGSDKRENEKPIHSVGITCGFWMGQTPVTQAQFREVIGTSPQPRFKGDDRPMERVSYQDSQDFCNFLGIRHGCQYRLPTEAEWEYACRAGTTTEYYSGDGKEALKKVGWHNANSGQQTRAVALLAPNFFGLHDMHGNVWEWCHDWYGSYPNEDIEDPQGALSGDARVLRGGSWIDVDDYCRAAYRYWNVPGNRNLNLGCRVCFRLG